MHAQLTLEQILTFLMETPLFRDLSADGLAEIVGIMQVQHLDAGQVLFRQGDVGDAWYIVYEGKVEVFREVGVGRRNLVVELGPRTCFGEMAVLDGSPRSGTVSAVEEATLLRFPRGAFQSLLADESLAAHQLVLAMARVLCARQRVLTGEVFGLLENPEADAPLLRTRMQRLVDAYHVSE